MGSKSRIAKYIVPIIQSYIDATKAEKYIEPFVGGANIIDKIICKEKYGYDKNKYLIALLQRVQDKQPLYKEVPKALYDKARKAFNNNNTSEFEDWQIGNIGFLASYNGRWFDGGYAKAGYEKTKTGLRLRDYYQEATNNILAQTEKIQNIHFKTCDYQEAIQIPKDTGLVIYCDPPYTQGKKYANATSFDYEKFWETMRKWSKYNTVLISEQEAPDDFICIWEQEVSRSIKPNSKRKSIERLFIYHKESEEIN